MSDAAPLQKISALRAYEALKGPNARYPSPKSGSSRLQPIPVVAHEAKFSMSATDRVFAIGSCFAREIERALTRAGLEVLSRDLDSFAPDMVSTEFRYLRNKYTTKSIVQDLIWAFEGATDEALALTYARSSDEDLWSNYNFGGGHAHIAAKLDVVLKAHRAFLNQIELAREANIVVLTLGLAEAWYDTRTGKYTNVAPQRPIVEHDPTRYELHVLSYEQIKDDLERAYALLRKHATVPQKMLLTVSPVPLHATFREQDVLQANCYSKSVLRAVAEGFSHDKPDVAYFPSYEIVTLADRDKAFLGNNGKGGTDWRHVNTKMIDHIMWSALSAYLSAEQLGKLPKLPPREQFVALINSRDYAKVIAIYEAVEAQSLSELYVPYYAGVSYMSTDQLDAAERCFTRALSLKSGHVPAHMHMARLQVKMGRPDEAREWARRALALDPTHAPAIELTKTLASAG